MIQATARRLAQSIPVIFAASIVVFLLVHLIPSDPAAVIAGPDASQTTIEAIREKFGLNRPLYVQYGIWVSQIARGNLGKSVISGIPARQLIDQAFPATMELAVASMLLIIFVGVPLGLAAAIREGGWYDRVATGVAAFLTGVPNFWLGILLILAFSVHLHWFPPSGRVSILSQPVLGLRFLALPVLALAPRLASILFLFVRTSTLEVLVEDYVRTARAKGLPERIVAFKHILRNALLPVLTVLSVQFSRLLAGAIVIETVFAWPGMGRLLVTSVNNLDYPVVQAVLLILVVIFIILNVLTDLLYGLVDPRIRFGA